jgi:hypothetical protein
MGRRLTELEVELSDILYKHYGSDLAIAYKLLKDLTTEIEKAYNKGFYEGTLAMGAKYKRKLAKLSKGDDEEEICICGQDDPTANGMRMDIICPKHDET